MNIRSKIRAWVLADQPVPPLASFHIPVEDAKYALENHVTVAVDNALQEIATNAVEEFFYSTDTGIALLHDVKAIIERYPAIDQQDVNEAVFEAIRKVFMR